MTEFLSNAGKYQVLGICIATGHIFFGNLVPFQLGDLFVPCVEHIKHGNIGNESDVLIADIDRYFKRAGHYLKHILTDIFYQNRNNLSYYKGQVIRL